MATVFAIVKVLLVGNAHEDLFSKTKLVSGLRFWTWNGFECV